jgi:hypothetical protein
VEEPHLRLVLAWGGDSLSGTDGDDGDGQGSRFWAVQHSPKGEAPFSAPQAKKNVGPKCRFTEFWVVFEWDGPWVAKSNIVGN